MNATPNQSQLPARKPYRAPALVSYGNLSEITHTVGMTGSLDGRQGAGHNRTRL